MLLPRVGAAARSMTRTLSAPAATSPLSARLWVSRCWNSRIEAVSTSRLDVRVAFWDSSRVSLAWRSRISASCRLTDASLADRESRSARVVIRVVSSSVHTGLGPRRTSLAPTVVPLATYSCSPAIRASMSRIGWLSG